MEKTTGMIKTWFLYIGHAFRSMLRWYAYGNLYAKQKANVSWSNDIPYEYQYRPKFSTMIRLNDVCKNLESVQHKVKIDQLYDSIRENLK